MKKLVSVASRTGRELQRYNLQGCRQVVGCIPYRLRTMEKSLLNSGTTKDRLEFLLISSQKSPKWMFPKGGWEIDESMEDAAIRETMEEAGVLGIVEDKLGCWTFKSKSQEKFHEGHMLSFKVTEELDIWPEKDVRRRIWVTAGEAREKCEHLWMKEALDSFISQVDEPQRKKEIFLAMEEEFGSPCLLEDGEPAYGITSQNGYGEYNTYHQLLLAQLGDSENVGSHCFLDDGESAYGITSQNGYEEYNSYHQFLLAQLENNEDFWTLMQLFTTSEPRIDIFAQSRDEKGTLCCPPYRNTDRVTKKEERQKGCLLEYLRNEERIVAPSGGEDVLVI